MTKKEMLKQLALDTGHTVAEVKEVVDDLTKITKEVLRKDGEVSLFGLGKLKCGHKAAHMGRNPKTGTKLVIQARNTARFAASKDLKAFVNE